MRRSLSLSAYLAYSRRTGRIVPPPEHERPAGALIWGHAADPARSNALIYLAERLAAQRAGLQMLLTTEGAPPTRLPRDGPVLWQLVPEDGVPAAESFLAHWRPDICLWTGGNLRPALLACAARRAISLYLLDADETPLERRAWRLFPDLPPAILSCFTEILARDEAAARLLRRSGAPDRIVSVTGAFREGAMILPVDMAERDEMAERLRSRPLWLAAMVRSEELETVLDAHREVSRLAHRSLLILVPDDLADSAHMRAVLDEQGWRVAVWSAHEMPEETTQVILGDTRGDMGLWYRLASVTFMGSSLISGQHGRDPNEPAAHGSAILYGPNVGRYLSRYSNYAEAGAARIVRDAETLTAAVQRLIAPDQAAVMAHAAWDVASRGAEVTDRILDTVLDRLDRLDAET